MNKLNYLVASTAVVLSGCFYMEAQPDNSNTTSNDGASTVQATVTNDPNVFNSLDLAVDENFDFDSTVKAEIRISAADNFSGALSNTSVKVYRVAEGISHWSDEYMMSAQLLTEGRTNADGEFSRLIEVPDTVTQVMVSLGYIGLENKVLVPVQNGTIEYHFN